jgi:hypothetical protein
MNQLLPPNILNLKKRHQVYLLIMPDNCLLRTKDFPCKHIHAVSFSNKFRNSLEGI